MSNFELENAYELRELDMRSLKRETLADRLAVYAFAVAVGLGLAIIIDSFFI